MNRFDRVWWATPRGDYNTDMRTNAVSTTTALLATLCLAFAGCAGGENVTTQSLNAARAKWDAAKIRDYELEWKAAGAMNSHYVVSVRDGQVRSIDTIAPDGRRYPAKSNKPAFFGVDGLFLTIAEEFAQLDTARPFGRPKGTSYVLKFTPDPTYGYPRDYRRDVVGAPQPLVIDVVRFEPAKTPH